MADPKQQPSYVGNPTTIPAKLIIKEWPTPFLDDRILVLRKDLRKFPDLPDQGSKYDGPNANKFRHFRFATAKAADQLGWVDYFYINERKNQDQYNFEVTYPYASKDYPTFTRTYVFLRGDQRANEPDADSKDPVYRDLSLTDHKVIRLQQPELDALFVGIQRVYERLPGPIITSYKMDDVQEEETINEQEDIAPAFPVIDALTSIATVERKTTAKAKVTFGTVPEVFPASVLRFGGEDPINPYRFRRFGVRIPAETVEQTSAGTAVMATGYLPTEFGHTETQVTKFKKRVSSQFRPIPAQLPVTIVQYKLTPEQQLATDTETFDTSIQTLVPDPLLIEGEVDNLGTTNPVESIMHRVTVPDVFSKARYGTDRPDPVPEKFKVTLPLFSYASTAAGTAGPVILGTGEFEGSDEQNTEFWHRSSLRARASVALPMSLINYRMTEQHQPVTVIETLDEGAIPDITGDIGITTVEAKVENLGITSFPDTNLTLKTVGTVPALFQEPKYKVSRPDGIWPERFRALVPETTFAGLTGGIANVPPLGTGELNASEEQIKTDTIKFEYTIRNTNYPTAWLEGQEYDQTLDVVVPYRERVEADGFTPIGTNRVDIFPQGDGTQRIKTLDLAALQAVLDAYLISFPSTVNLELPDILVSLAGIMTNNSGSGNSNESGAAAFTNHGSATTDLSTHAEGNAVIISELLVEILQPWARNVPVTHYLFFLPIPVAPADVLTHLSFLLGSTVNTWPKWNPLSLNIIAVGGSVEERVSARNYCHLGGDSCSIDCPSSQGGFATGTGYSEKVGVTVKTVHIPPTIHGALSIGGTTSSSASVTVTTTCQELLGCGLPDNTITRTGLIGGGIGPVDIPATPSDNTIPTTGLYIHKIDSEPYRWGYAKVHAEVVDFANVSVLPS